MTTPNPLMGRWRAIAAAASALAAMALAAAVAGRGCRVEEGTPVSAVRELVHAADADDRKAIFALLSPATQARLEDAARRASALAGGAERYTALDLVSVGASGPERERPAAYELVHEDERTAVVEIVARGGERSRVGLVRVEDQWRVDVPAFGAGRD